MTNDLRRTWFCEFLYWASNFLFFIFLNTWSHKKGLDFLCCISQCHFQVILEMTISLKAIITTTLQSYMCQLESLQDFFFTMENILLNQEHDWGRQVAWKNIEIYCKYIYQPGSQQKIENVSGDSTEDCLMEGLYRGAGRVRGPMREVKAPSGYNRGKLLETLSWREVGPGGIWSQVECTHCLGQEV